jgi:hypothetical protein
LNKFRMIYIAGVLWCSFNIGTTLSSCCIRERFGIDDLFILLISALSSAAFIGLIKLDEFCDRLSIEVHGLKIGKSLQLTIVYREERPS